MMRNKPIVWVLLLKLLTNVEDCHFKYDITHGLAGQGLTYVHPSDVLESIERNYYIEITY